LHTKRKLVHCFHHAPTSRNSPRQPPSPAYCGRAVACINKSTNARATLPCRGYFFISSFFLIMNTPTKAPHIEAAPGIRTANELSAILDRNDMSHSAVGIPHGSDVCRQRIQKNTAKTHCDVSPSEQWRYDSTEQTMVSTSGAEAVAATHARQCNVYFDSESQDIGQYVASFRAWMENVFKNVRRKSYTDSSRLRHTKFAVPRRFIRHINAPDHVEADKDGIFTHDGTPIMIY